MAAIVENLQDAQGPHEIAQWIVHHNEQVSPINTIDLAKFIAKEFGGMKGYAMELKSLYDAEGVTPAFKADILKIVKAMFDIAFSLQEPQKDARDLDDAQVVAMAKYLMTMTPDGPDENNAEGRPFGT